MSHKPTLILDAHWRQINELFSDQTLHTLHQHFDVIWGRDEPMPAEQLRQALPGADILVSAQPTLGAELLARAGKLHTVIEVAGSFPDTIDYALCRQRNIEVLSCAPGFQNAVAEMALAMTLAGARGLISEHERFRVNQEHWLSDNISTDFTLFGASIAFIGYGSIARATHRLLASFNVHVSAYDPWLSAEAAQQAGIRLCTLQEAMNHRCVYVTASPSRENYRMINAELLTHLPDAALLVVISRAHLIDFEAVVDAAESGRIRVAIDVFPEEPLAADHRARQLPGMILSPHRAAAVRNGRQPIGDMLLHDLLAKQRGDHTRQLQTVPENIQQLSGVGDADQVGSIALQRSDG